MNFLQSIRTCFKKYAVFKGRATRSEFWWFQLFAIIATVSMTSLDYLILGYTWDDPFTPLAILTDVVTLLPVAAVTARRLHDIGWSGWWQLPIFAMYVVYLDVVVPGLSDSALVGGVILAVGVYSLWLLVMMIKDSEPKTNEYGPNPKSPEMGEVFS